MRRVLLSLLLLGWACSADKSAAGKAPIGAAGDVSVDREQAPRHWPKPPSGEVRSYPPHAIRGDGIGPYLVGAPLSEVLHLLPEDPRVELIQVDSLVDWRVVRPEGGDLIIGADDHNRVAFLAALVREVARTENGMSVGVTVGELITAFAPERPRTESTDRLVEFQTLPGVRFVLDESMSDSARVVAVIVGAATGSTTPRSSCRTLGGRLEPEILALLRLAKTAQLPIFRQGCFSGSVPETLAVSSREIWLFGGEPGRIKRLGRAVLETDPQLVFAIDVDGDGRDEIAVTSDVRERDHRAVEVRLFRFEAGRLLLLATQTPFEVGASAAAAAGVLPGAIEFVVALESTEAGLSVGGLYYTKIGSRVRDLAPVKPVLMRLPGLPSKRRAPLLPAAPDSGSGGSGEAKGE